MCVTVSNFIKIGQTFAIYGNSVVFIMAAVRHLGFLKFKLFNGRTKFRTDRSTHRGDTAIFVIFRMVAAAILDFQKFEILMVFLLQGANMHHHTIFHQNLSNGCRYFQNGGRPPSWIFEIQIFKRPGRL